MTQSHTPEGAEAVGSQGGRTGTQCTSSGKHFWPGEEDRSVISMFSLFLAFHCLEPVNKEKNYKATATDNHLLEEKGIQQEELLSWLRD